VTDFVCEVDAPYRSACEGLGFYGEHDGNRYCVLHFPCEDKDESLFRRVLEIKLKYGKCDFKGVEFLDGTAEFADREFDEPAYLIGATLRNANFFGTKFNGASFSNATFVGGTHFSKAIFSDWVSFTQARFDEEASFRESWFGGKYADFSKAAFCGRMAIFSKASFTCEEVDFSKVEFHNHRRTSFSDAWVWV
jgi:hypothetical protein